MDSPDSSQSAGGSRQLGQASSSAPGEQKTGGGDGVGSEVLATPCAKTARVPARSPTESL